MAYYLVEAVPKKDLLGNLESSLRYNLFSDLKPFGKALTYSLLNARLKEDGVALWEEEDYCNPPLYEEKKLLNLYFQNITASVVEKGLGWKKINNLPKLFPENIIH